MGYWDIMIVSDGVEVVEQVSKAETIGLPFELVFMDMLMPVVQRLLYCLIFIRLEPRWLCSVTIDS